MQIICYLFLVKKAMPRPINITRPVAAPLFVKIFLTFSKFDKRSQNLVEYIKKGANYGST